MKSIALFLATLPLLYSCGGKDSGPAAQPSPGGVNPGSGPQKKDPALPANHKLLLEDSVGNNREAEVSADGKMIYIFPSTRKPLALTLELGNLSVGSSFITVDGSQAKGCARRQSFVDNLVSTFTQFGRADQIDSALDVYRTELRIEAGFVRASLESAEPSDELRRQAVSTAQAAGFPGATLAVAATIRGARVPLDQYALGSLTESQSEIETLVSNLAQGIYPQQRVLNGEVCALVMNHGAALAYGGAAMTS